MSTGFIDSISCHCSGNEPVLLPGRMTGLEKAAEIEPTGFKKTAINNGPGCLYKAPVHTAGFDCNVKFVLYR